MYRWPLAVGALLLLSACAAGETTGPPAPDSTSSAPLRSEPIDGKFSVGDRELYLNCSGSGEPTILLEGGEGQSFDALQTLRAALEPHAYVCSYDRANIGSSDPAEVPRSAEQVTADLDALLDAAGVSGPFVPVGHSAGGMLVQHFARTHLDEVIGAVAMNPVPRYDWAQELMFPEMSEEERASEDDYFRGENAEGLDYAASSEQLAAAPVPGQVPFAIVMSTIDQCGSVDDICGRTYAGYEKIMTRTAAEWDHSVISQVPDADHEVYLDAPDVVLAAINDILTTGGYEGIL